MGNLPDQSLPDQASPYQGYLYAYPHKTAYRRLEPRPLLTDVWRDEPADALFLYVHLPYCEMRCGFCNLFTRANPPHEQVTAYLNQLEVQARRVRAAIPEARYAQAAFGGGTPTYLTAEELHRLFDIVGVRGIPVSVETSPATATPDRLAVLRERGVTRISIGVQSFLDREAHAAGRPQHRAEVDRALDAIRQVPAELNIDLIYGIPGQTSATWETSLRTALRWRPEELFLYPLYVRPLTGLSRRSTVDTDDDWDAQRLSLYEQGRDLLRAEGYVQRSMRAFRHRDAPATGTEYCCQNDGMVGLGCGARSYTTGLHYSFDYAVSVREVRGILDDYLSRPPEDFDHAEVGFHLDASEQRRRWLLKSLLQAGGLSRTGYARRFGTAVDDDFPHLARLGELIDLDALRLTDKGLARSDAIGPWLVSAGVRRAMAEHGAR